MATVQKAKIRIDYGKSNDMVIEGEFSIDTTKDILQERIAIENCIYDLYEEDGDIVTGIEWLEIVEK